MSFHNTGDPSASLNSLSQIGGVQKRQITSNGSVTVLTSSMGKLKWITIMLGIMGIANFGWIGMKFGAFDLLGQKTGLGLGKTKSAAPESVNYSDSVGAVKPTPQPASDTTTNTPQKLISPSESAILFHLKGMSLNSTSRIWCRDVTNGGM